MPPVRSSDLLHVAIVVDDPKLSDEIRGCIHEIPVHVEFETPMLRPRQELVQRIQSAGVQVVLLDFHAAGDAAADAVADIKAVLPECRVLAVGKAAEAEAILGAFRAGCSDYLTPPLKRSLIAALGRIQQEQRKALQQAAPPGGSILGILSAKGGCGATTIACHVAAELRRITSEKVLLADLDLVAGVASFLMKAERRHTIIDAIENTNRLDPSFWGALVTDRSGLDVVVAPPPASAAPSPASVSETLQFLRSQYRFVVADLGRGLNPFIEAAVDEMDRVFLVTTAERPALHRAREMAEYFTEKRSPRVDTRMILNRVSQSRWQMTADDCRDLVGLPVCCEISNDYRELYEALIAGKLVPPKSRLGKDFTNAACAIARVTGSDQPKASISLAPAWLKAAADLLR